MSREKDLDLFIKKQQQQNKKLQLLCIISNILRDRFHTALLVWLSEPSFHCITQAALNSTPPLPRSLMSAGTTSLCYQAQLLQHNFLVCVFKNDCFKNFWIHNLLEEVQLPVTKGYADWCQAPAPHGDSNKNMKKEAWLLWAVLCQWIMINTYTLLRQFPARWELAETKSWICRYEKILRSQFWTSGTVAVC